MRTLRYLVGGLLAAVLVWRIALHDWTAPAWAAIAGEWWVRTAPRRKP